MKKEIYEQRQISVVQTKYQSKLDIDQQIDKINTKNNLIRLNIENQRQTIKENKTNYFSQKNIPLSPQNECIHSFKSVKAIERNQINRNKEQQKFRYMDENVIKNNNNGSVNNSIKKTIQKCYDIQQFKILNNQKPSLQKIPLLQSQNFTGNIQEQQNMKELNYKSEFLNKIE